MIELRPHRIYIVGEQMRTAPGWSAAPILDLKNLSSPLTIRGNGARLLAQPGRRFGMFNLELGKPWSTARRT